MILKVILQFSFLLIGGDNEYEAEQDSLLEQVEIAEIFLEWFLDLG